VLFLSRLKADPEGDCDDRAEEVIALFSSSRLKADPEADCDVEPLLSSSGDFAGRG